MHNSSTEIVFPFSYPFLTLFLPFFSLKFPLSLPFFSLFFSPLLPVFSLFFPLRLPHLSQTRIFRTSWFTAHITGCVSNIIVNLFRETVFATRTRFIVKTHFVYTETTFSQKDIALKIVVKYSKSVLFCNTAMEKTNQISNGKKDTKCSLRLVCFLAITESRFLFHRTKNRTMVLSLLTKPSRSIPKSKLFLLPNIFCC